MIIPKHVLGSVPVEKLAEDPFFRNPTVGTGPYQFVANRVDQYVELAANPNYRKPVGVQRLFLKPVTADVATAQLGTGEMDVANSLADRAVRAVEGFDSRRPVGRPRTAGSSGSPSTRPSPGSPIRGCARRSCTRSTARASWTPRCPVWAGPQLVFDPWVSGDLPRVHRRPGKAKQLLTAAGWDIRGPVTLPGSRQQPRPRCGRTAVQSQLTAIGVNAKLKSVDRAAHRSVKKMAFDMYLFGGGNYAADPGRSTRSSAATGHPDGGNIGKFCDPELDAMMKQANATADESNRLGLYSRRRGSRTSRCLPVALHLGRAVGGQQALQNFHRLTRRWRVLATGEVAVEADGRISGARDAGQPRGAGVDLGRDLLAGSVAPGDPVEMMLPPENGARERGVRGREAGRARHGPTPARAVLLWLGHAVTGDLGYSLAPATDRSEMIAERIGPTVYLMGLSLLLSLVIAVPLGLFAAMRKGSFVDYAASVSASARCVCRRSSSASGHLRALAEARVAAVGGDVHPRRRQPGRRVAAPGDAAVHSRLRAAGAFTRYVRAA